MSTKSKKTSTSSTAAASWAQPYIDDSLKGLQGASDMSQANAGAAQPYLMQAIQRIGGDLANPAGYMADAQRQISGMMNGGGTNPYAAMLANNPYAQTVADAGRNTNPYAAQIAAAGGTANPYLDQLASGSPYATQLGQYQHNQYADALAKGDPDLYDKIISASSADNPWATDMIRRIGQDAGAQAAASFGNSGRTGSGLAALKGAEGIANAIGNVRYNQYESDQALRQSALSTVAQMRALGLQGAANAEDASLTRAQQGLTLAAQMQQAGLLNAANLSNTDRQTQLAALGNAAGITGGDLDRQLAAANSAAQWQQSGAQQAAGVYDTGQQRAMQAALAAPNFQLASYAGIDPLSSLMGLSTALPLQGAQTYANAVQGVTQPYATQSQVDTMKTGGLGQIASLAIQGLGAAGGVPGLGSAIGGLGSLFKGNSTTGYQPATVNNGAPIPARSQTPTNFGYNPYQTPAYYPPYPSYSTWPPVR